jgi:hypothetical protein
MLLQFLDPLHSRSLKELTDAEFECLLAGLQHANILTPLFFHLSKPNHPTISEVSSPTAVEVTPRMKGLLQSGIWALGGLEINESVLIKVLDLGMPVIFLGIQAGKRLQSTKYF